MMVRKSFIYIMNNKAPKYSLGGTPERTGKGVDKDWLISVCMDMLSSISHVTLKPPPQFALYATTITFTK